MNLMNKLNRKFGKYAIHNLMLYVVVLYALGFFISMFNPYFYYQYLSLDISKVLRGELWRLVTFIIRPPSTSLLFLVFSLYLYYMIGNALENAWGAFKFNLYYLSGILLNIIGTFIFYFITGYNIHLGITYINQAMFFAFASLYPNVQFLLFFFIPVKVKYLSYLYGAFVAYDIFTSLVSGDYGRCIMIILALGNFFVYFLSSRNYRSISPKEFKRRNAYKKAVRATVGGDNVVEFQGRKRITRHKCSICGRTELDDENLEFRFCSKCDGNHEYCMDHLFTHEHVHE
ncbi:MAG: rhomboid family intramembrane serine protease [Anaerocolumna sp.]